MKEISLSIPVTRMHQSDEMVEADLNFQFKAREWQVSCSHLAPRGLLTNPHSLLIYEWLPS